MISMKKHALAALVASLITTLTLPIFGQDLWQASAEGDLKTVKQLLKDGADANSREPSLGLTPMVMAVMQDQPKVVRLLVKNGADVNLGGADGNTPMHGAMFLGHDKVVKELLRAGADPFKPNGQGQDSLFVGSLDWQTTQYIASMIQIEVVEEEVNVGREKAMALVEKELDRRAKSDIWLAVRRDNEKAVKRLAKKTEDLNALHSDLQSSLITLASTYGYAGVVDILAEAGADVNIKGGDGATPLLVAAFFGRDEVVKSLLAHGADTTLTNNDGTTPLMAAQADMAMVDYVAGMLNLELDYDAVIEGKRAAAELLSN